MRVITTAALSRQLFKDSQCQTHDFPHGSPVLNQLSHRLRLLKATAQIPTIRDFRPYKKES